MKYIGMPAGMWLLFSGSFRKQLTSVLKYDPDEAKNIASAARCSFLRNLPERPDVAKTTAFYRESMMTGPMKWFCRRSGKRKFTDADIRGMQETAALRAADRNPYSWNMEYLPYPDGSGYEARFTACGICVLMKELGLYELVPAMCRLDYTMSEAGGTTAFVREYTLASGGPYCDCRYKKLHMS